MSTICPATPSSAPRPAAAAWTVECMDLAQDQGWDRIALTHPECSIFHLSSWARVLQSAYGHRPVFLVCRREGGELAALIPMMELSSCLSAKRAVSMPFADCCPPLLFGTQESASLFEAVRDTAAGRDWKSFEIRGGPPPATSALPSVSYYVHSLPLTPEPESLSSRFDASFRQAVRKATREGVTPEIRTDEAALREYYRLHVRTRRRHGAPPQPWNFFRLLWQEIIGAGHGFIVLGHLRGTAVAGAVFLHTLHHAMYKFGASDERNLECRANNLVMSAAIQHLAERGFQSLHFGRTSMHQSGLRRFKLGWGAEEKVLSCFKYDLRRAAWTSGTDRAAGWQSSIFSRLPQSVNRLAGRLLYPHLD